jgi:hypothetical protein
MNNGGAGNGHSLIVRLCQFLLNYGMPDEKKEIVSKEDQRFGDDDIGIRFLKGLVDTPQSGFSAILLASFQKSAAAFEMIRKTIVLLFGCSTSRIQADHPLSLSLAPLRFDPLSNSALMREASSIDAFPITRKDTRSHNFVRRCLRSKNIKHFLFRDETRRNSCDRIRGATLQYGNLGRQRTPNGGRSICQRGCATNV